MRIVVGCCGGIFSSRSTLVTSSTLFKHDYDDHDVYNICINFMLSKENKRRLV